MRKLLTIAVALLVGIISSKKIVITEQERLQYIKELRQEFNEAQKVISHIQQDLNNLQRLQPVVDEDGQLFHTLEVSDFPQVQNVVKNYHYVNYGNNDNLKFNIDGRPCR
ncbi:UNKNOWN [Stylonychia lemnae]|uniref:Uncharacterized protein n=1 Tax=Stylonychia lemnae TaxID=5949 RepID=A0A078AYM4_STYLE|nr:UNKNOWN [Stylonychia lemnae]|eukprot:CDW87530.1 UNKNOWN [Stylonychia lemnae]